MSLYRNTIFIFKGLREFGKSGYASASKKFDSNALEVDVSNQAFMITGANSGIGKAAALAIAKKGGTVHMVCRNPERGETAQKEITEESGNNNIHLHILDMSDCQKVCQFAQEFAESGKSINVLVNNAGCMVNEREVTPDGLEKNFATNTMGTYLLTTMLLSCLKQNRNSRVITVSSGGMYTHKLNLADLQSENGTFDGTMVYAHQKRQQVIMTEQWAKAFPEIHFSVMHPGWADTPAVRTSMPGFYNSMKNKLRTAEQGADTIIWLAIAEAVAQQPSGNFWLDRSPQSTHLSMAWTRSSKEEEEKLMTTLNEMASKFK